MSGSICGGVAFEWRRIGMCWTEGKRRRFYVSQSSLWYSPTWVCLGCGDSWSDGERGERPFYRNWRADAIAKAKRDWAAVSRTPAETLEAIHAELTVIA
jgi:hypothetical protein